MFWNKKLRPSTEAEFDIEGLEVFSVERDSDGDTTFGYMRDGKESEWCVRTTDERHQQFVARFTAKLQKRDSGAQAGTPLKKSKP